MLRATPLAVVSMGNHIVATEFTATEVGNSSLMPGVSAVPELATGTEAIGNYEGSGYKEPLYLVRRGDGQLITLTRLLYLVVAHTDGHRDLHQIAALVSRDFGRRVTGNNVSYLLSEKLEPLGLVPASGAGTKLRPADPLLGLKFRVAVVPAQVIDATSGILQHLFHPPIVALVLAGFVGFDVWLFFFHGLGQAFRQVLYQPVLILMLLGLVIASMVFHELGHAAACRYGGGKPGVVGLGLYIAWPAFYTDVTDSYRLDKAGRLRTDLGGVYFNVLFLGVTAAVYFATGFEPLLLLILIQHIEIFQQFLPFLRLDGYYAVTDLTGVPDLFGRIKPLLQSLVPGHDADQRVDDLKPRVRVTVTVWILVTIPVLAVNFIWLLVNVPTIVGASFTSIALQATTISIAAPSGRWVAVLLGVAQLLLATLPPVAITVTFGWTSTRLARAAFRWSKGRPVVRAAIFVGVAVALALLLLSWST